MKHTLLQACKKIITTSDPTDLGWSECTTPYQVFMVEYGNHHGFTQQSVTDYCHGLPSLFTFPFNNHEILDTLADYGITRNRNSAVIKLIEDYWFNIGYAAFHVLKESATHETV